MKKEEAKPYAGFGLIAIFVILVISGGISLLNIYKAKAEFRQVGKTTSSYAEILHIFSEVIDIKKVEQGYVVMNEDLNLEASAKAQEDIRSHIRSVRQLSAANKIIDVEIVDQLDRLIIERFAELNTHVTAATDKGYVDAETLFASKQRRRIMDDIYACLLNAKNQLESSLMLHNKQTESAFSLVLTMIAFGGASVILISIIVARKIKNDIAKYKHAASTLKSLEESEQRLKQAQDDLESRVRQRTNALLKSNQQLLNEILEHKKADETVASRLRYERGLAEFAKCLLSGFKSSQVMDNALKQLLKAIQVSRVYLQQIYYDGQGEKEGEEGNLKTRNISTASILCVDSNRENTPPPPVPWQEVFEHWESELAAGRHVSATCDDMNADQLRIFNNSGVLSTLLLPIHINKEWYGVLGFDDSADQRQWSDEDIQLLRTAGDLITIYLSRMQTLGELIAYQDKLRSLASKLTRTEERERHRIAEGLHDEIIQPMIFVKIRLDVLKRQTDDPKVSQACVEMMVVMDKLTEDTRQFTFELSCPVLHEVGLEAAIDDFMSTEICEKYGVLTEFEHHDEPVAIDNDMSIFLYKAARELLTNMIKHAGASTVKVTLAQQNNNIVLSVEDDGIGFNMHAGPVDIDRPGGFGLFSIRERLSCLGGRLDIESEIGHGTRAVMVAPINPELVSIGDN